jgi:FtsP/CotA-like multicopper oxidase with cupredoxin domain
LEPALFTIRQNTPRIFRLVNLSDAWHPIHFHLDFMRVLSRNGKAPARNEQDGLARKDTIVLRDHEVVEVFLRQRDYPGKFIVHSQNLERQSRFMMARYDIV